MNTFGNIFRLSTFGESHGEAIGGVIDGMPAGIDIDIEFISGCGAVNAELQGSGDINLKGHVQRFDMHKRGSGDINTSALRIN